MLDYRMETFLAVCEQESFTRAAERLHITQPAVSQHIRALETLYGVRLFASTGRHLRLTEAGERLRRFARVVRNDADRLAGELAAMEHAPAVRFGATRTIGEFTMPAILDRLMRRDGDRRISMLVDNTDALLRLLDAGEIDFAFIEGTFDKTAYAYRLLSRQRFIGICSPACAERHPRPSIERLYGERLLVREPGSGTRFVFEQILRTEGIAIDQFRHVDEIGNINVIKNLVAEDLGISFLYEEAVRKELGNGSVRELDIRGWHVEREFNFVYQLGSRDEERFLRFFAEC